MTARGDRLAVEQPPPRDPLTPRGDALPGELASSAGALLVRVRVLFVLVGALPWAIPLARSRVPLGGFGEALDRLFVPMCHRLPERSLALGGVLMPVCSRCAGIFAGIAIGAALARPRLSMTIWRPVLLAIGALMVVDVATQDLGVHPVWHPVRLATGLAFGYAAAASFMTHLVRRPS